MSPLGGKDNGKNEINLFPLTWHPVYSSIYGILEKINILILMLLNSVTLKNQKESFNKYQPKVL